MHPKHVLRGLSGLVLTLLTGSVLLVWFSPPLAQGNTAPQYWPRPVTPPVVCETWLHITPPGYGTHSFRLSEIIVVKHHAAFVRVFMGLRDDSISWEFASPVEAQEFYTAFITKLLQLEACAAEN